MTIRRRLGPFCYTRHTAASRGGTCRAIIVVRGSGVNSEAAFGSIKSLAFAASVLMIDDADRAFASAPARSQTHFAATSPLSLFFFQQNNTVTRDKWIKESTGCLRRVNSSLISSRVAAAFVAAGAWYRQQSIGLPMIATM